MAKNTLPNLVNYEGHSFYDSETKEIVGQVYQKEIEYFDYTY
jgi:hypothetical protein